VRWILYNVLFTIGYVLMAPGFLLRMLRRGGYRPNFRHRFGRYDAATADRLAALRTPHSALRPPHSALRTPHSAFRTPHSAFRTPDAPLWIHAVSVGEVGVAVQVMAALRGRDPSLRFVLSTTSSTGWREAAKRVGPADVLLYNPLDFPPCAARALDAIGPRALLLTESEIWPNLIRACGRRGIPVMLVNGRISDRSAPRYRLLRFWFGPVLRQFGLLLAQSDLDRDRLAAAGADAARMVVTGSVKFDAARRDPSGEGRAAAALAGLDMGAGRRVLLGGSTWPGEETILLGIYRRLRERHADLRLVLVPRHFERGDEVAADIAAAGFACVRQSRLDAGAAPPPADGPPPVLLVDTTGDLMGFYAHAAVAFVGKSLAARGAQNMIEPCLCGVPTIVGPHTQNFRPVMADLLAAGAIVQVDGAAQLERRIGELLAQPDACRALGERAAAAVARRRGVVGRCAELILQQMEAHA
jgi:3-deoxy-D-manno-octulosonic-acid transferase